METPPAASLVPISPHTCLSYFKVPNELSHNLTVSCYSISTSNQNTNEGQKSSFHATSYFMLYKDPNNVNSYPLLVLYQHFDSTPGKLVSNDLKKSIRYFQTTFGIKNTIISTDNHSYLNEYYIDIVYTSPSTLDNTVSKSKTVSTEKNFSFGLVGDVTASISPEGVTGTVSRGGNFDFASKRHSSYSESFDILEWGVTELTNGQSNAVQNATSQWVFNQNLPFDTSVDTEENKHSWFQSKAIQEGFRGWYAASHMYGKSLPGLSTSTLKACTFTVWQIPSVYNSIILLDMEFTHGLGNINFGSHYEGENKYKTSEYSKSQKILVNLKDLDFLKTFSKL